MAKGLYSTALVITLLSLLLLGPFWVGITGQVDLLHHWRTANRASAKIAPEPRLHPEPIIQIYAARAYNWRGQFAVHTWLALKHRNAKYYTVYQVTGWRLYSGLPVLQTEPDIPDRYWYGNKPSVIMDVRGSRAEDLIPQIEKVVLAYPYPNRYELWPGPNSNTFIAYIGRSIPELQLDMPATAIGKDYLPNGKLWAKAPSGTGYQISLHGLLGVMVSRIEGLEINILGLVVGINPWRGVIKIPGIGNVDLRHFWHRR